MCVGTALCPLAWEAIACSSALVLSQRFRNKPLKAQSREQSNGKSEKFFVGKKSEEKSTSLSQTITEQRPFLLKKTPACLHLKPPMCACVLLPIRDNSSPEFFSHRQTWRFVPTVTLRADFTAQAYSK